MSELQQKEHSQERSQPLVLRLLATIISYIFHPVFIPLLMTLVLYRLSPIQFAGIQEKDLGLLLMKVALHTAFFPLLTVLLLKGLGFIESIHMLNPKERLIPLIGSMIFYFWAYWVFKNTNAPFILRVLLLGSFWGVITVFMTSIFFKISMHTAGAGSMIGILAVLTFLSPVNLTIPLFIVFVLAGLIGTSRMILSAHIRSEIWLGYIVGFLVQVAAYWYLN